MHIHHREAAKGQQLVAVTSQTLHQRRLPKVMQSVLVCRLLSLRPDVISRIIALGIIAMRRRSQL
jgi:hypothetical protein